MRQSNSYSVSPSVGPITESAELESVHERKEWRFTVEEDKEKRRATSGLADNAMDMVAGRQSFPQPVQRRARYAAWAARQPTKEPEAAAGFRHLLT